MSIPVATTTVTVQRVVSRTDPSTSLVDLDSEDDYGDESTTTAINVVTGLRAHIGSPSGIRQFGPGGERERVVWKFTTDPFDGVIVGDDVLIDANGDQYVVWWARKRGELGVTFITGQCYQEVGSGP